MNPTIASAALDALQQWGKHPCLVELRDAKNALPVSADELRSRILDASVQLSRWGLQRGTLVAVFLENSIDYVVILLALVRLKAIPVLGKLEYRTLELNEVFENSDPPVVISEQHHLSLLEPYLRGRTVISRTDQALRLVQQRAEPAEPADLADDIASVNYTYRGYGYPLGALVSHQQYLDGARVLQEEGLQAAPGDRMLYSIPMSHIFTLVGCIMVPLLYGLTGVIARTIHPRVLFDAINVLKIQHVTAVPELYALLRRAAGDSTQLPSLQAFVCGGSVLGDGEYHALRETFGVEVLHGYGLTEFTPVSRNSRGKARAGTVGPVCQGVECRIDSKDGSATGEILIRAASMSQGYYRRPRESQQSRAGDWLRTGDIGHFDGDHLVFDAEEKLTRKVNGVIVDLEEIRRALCLDPDIADAIVRAHQNSVEVDVVPARHFAPNEKIPQIRASLKQLLAPYKVPKTINLQR